MKKIGETVLMTLRDKMGINLVLPFSEGDETEYVEMTIHPDKSIEFPIYDFEHDEVLVELGEEQSQIYEFCKGWDGYHRMGLMKFAEDDDWADALVAAVNQQGLGGFEKEQYIRFFTWCLDKDCGFEFEPLEEVKKILTEDEYIDFLKSCVRNPSGDFDFGPDELLVELIGEEPFINWLLEELRANVKSDNSSKSPHLAAYVHEYISKDEAEIESEDLHFYEENEYTNTVGKKYCLYIKKTEIGCWKIVVESRIINPIGFHSDVSEWTPEEMGAEYGMPDSMSGVLAELDIADPELADPDPPDHPKKDSDGKYATLYLVKDIYQNVPYWVLVPYKSEFDAQEAAELSSIILERDGEREVVEIYTATKKDNPNDQAEKQIRRELGEHTTIREDVKDGEEWDTRWTKVYDVGEDI